MCKRSICYLSCFLMLGMAQATWGELVAHWTLNEGTGVQVMDSSGNGNTGTISGSPTWIAGASGGALEFHGLGAAGGGGDYINCGADASLNPLGPISIALWIRPDADQPESKGTETAPMAKADQNASPSWSYQVRYGWGSTSPYMAFTFNTSPRAWAYVGRNLNRFEWAHIACSHDGATLKCYLNGEQTDSTSMGAITSSPASVLIGSDGWGCDWIGAIDDVRIYNHGLTVEEIEEILAGGGVELAKDPNPADTATDVPYDGTLSWTPGEYAAAHDVYLGTAFDDVNDATRDDPRDTLVSQGQNAAEYTSEEPLEFGQTYYWRIDEVNAAPDNTIFKGVVWSFTTEPYGYPITEVTAQASSQQPASPAVSTVDRSGLDDLDQHGVDVKTMWLANMPAWIQYTFDKEYTLHELWVWNANSEIETIMGFGAKDVTVEYSTDGETWTPLENVPQFAQATGMATYMANTVVSFGGVTAKYVKLTVNAAYGATGVVGLSEVRFFYTPTQAFVPDPADGAAGIALDATLNWRPGRDATSHEVYFGSDPNALADDTVTDHSYTPASLEFGTNYWWKVDEVTDVGTCPGEVWSFTTQEFASIDSFEDYTDNMEAHETIWDAWIDGVTTEASGSQVGYTDAPFAEQLIVHGGKQSMPFMYDNATKFYFSEAERTFDPVQKWTGNGASELCLWVRGYPAKFIETSPGQYTISANTADIWGASDNFRFVYKRLTGNGSISAKVLSITGGSTTWAKAGVMIRGSLDPASTYALMHPTPDGRRSFQNRTSVGGSAVSAHSNTGAVTFPVWVKVERQGNQITGYYSLNGTTWTKQPDTENTGTDQSPNPQTIGMTDPVYIGLAVASNNSAAGYCFGEFSDVVTAGGVTGDWTVASIGDNPGNDAATMYVTVEDSTGKSGTATNADIVTSVDWTPWVIPMSDFAGVNFGKVEKMTIRIGDRNATAAGGVGKVFIDDIGYGRSAQ